jgi:hypothetical protein
VYSGGHVRLPVPPSWVDNWVRLGLVNVSYVEFASGLGRYDWVEKRPEYIHLTEILAGDTRDSTIEFNKGVLRVTDFGQQFLSAINRESNRAARWPRGGALGHRWPGRWQAVRCDRYARVAILMSDRVWRAPAG